MSRSTAEPGIGKLKKTILKVLINERLLITPGLMQMVFVIKSMIFYGRMHLNRELLQLIIKYLPGCFRNWYYCSTQISELAFIEKFNVFLKYCFLLNPVFVILQSSICNFLNSSEHWYEYFDSLLSVARASDNFFKKATHLFFSKVTSAKNDNSWKCNL